MTLCALQKGKFKAAVGDVLQEAGVLSFNTTGTARTASFPLSFAAKNIFLSFLAVHLQSPAVSLFSDHIFSSVFFFEFLVSI